MHLGNLLFENNEFRWYLDFDIAQRNARIFEICYLGASMLVDNYQDAERFNVWKEIFRGVLDGYQSNSVLNEMEVKSLRMMFVIIEVIFTAFFAKLKEKENQVDV